MICEIECFGRWREYLACFGAKEIPLSDYIAILESALSTFDCRYAYCNVSEVAGDVAHFSNWSEAVVELDDEGNPYFGSSRLKSNCRRVCFQDKARFVFRYAPGADRKSNMPTIRYPFSSIC